MAVGGHGPRLRPIRRGPAQSALLGGGPARATPRRADADTAPGHGDHRRGRPAGAACAAHPARLARHGGPAAGHRAGPRVLLARSLARPSATAAAGWYALAPLAAHLGRRGAARPGGPAAAPAWRRLPRPARAGRRAPRGQAIKRVATPASGAASSSSRLVPSDDALRSAPALPRQHRGGPGERRGRAPRCHRGRGQPRGRPAPYQDTYAAPGTYEALLGENPARVGARAARGARLRRVRSRPGAQATARSPHPRVRRGGDPLDALLVLDGIHCGWLEQDPHHLNDRQLASFAGPRAPPRPARSSSPSPTPRSSRRATPAPPPPPSTCWARRARSARRCGRADAGRPRAPGAAAAEGAVSKRLEKHLEPTATAAPGLHVRGFRGNTPEHHMSHLSRWAPRCCPSWRAAGARRLGRQPRRRGERAGADRAARSCLGCGRAPAAPPARAHATSMTGCPPLPDGVVHRRPARARHASR